MIPIRRSAAVLLTAGLLAGCSATAHPAPAASFEPATAWAQTLSRVQPDGTVDTATALAAFSLAIGPVPGVPRPAGATQVIPSGTVAVQWVLGHWGQLTAAQQHAVLGDLGVVTTAAFDRKPSPEPEIPCLGADVGATAPYRSQLAGLESEIAGHIGGLPFGPEIHLSVNNVQVGAADWGLYTVPCTGGPKSVAGCTIHVNPLVAKGNFPAGEVHDFLIHELTHCYLSLNLGDGYYRLPSWYVEGVPMWAQTVLGSGSRTGTAYWRDYLDSPGTSLFARVYDALGFYVHLAETGTDVWHRILPAGQAMTTGGNAAGWRAFAPSATFLDSWGSGYAEGRYPGQPWRTGGENLPTYQGPVPQAEIKDGQTFPVRSSAAATAITHLDLDAQVVVLSGTGDGRFSLDGDADVTLAQAAGVAYATGSPSTCPAGSAGAGSTLTPISSGSHYVAVTGGLSSGDVTVQGLSLADFCARPARPCLVGTWRATGFDATTRTLTERGGAGVVLRITAAGAMTVDFDPMAPVALSGSLEAGLVFRGQVHGQVVLPGGTQQGAWRQKPGTKADYHTLIATVHVTSPIDYTFGPVSVLDLAKQMGSAGSAVDTQPLSTGTWTCSGDTLAVRAPAGVPSDGTWTFARTS